MNFISVIIPLLNDKVFEHEMVINGINMIGS
jgi:hypothetical protein